jgi:leader peptidase (prepilin peptidase) / N-methyltransferase
MLSEPTRRGQVVVLDWVLTGLVPTAFLLAAFVLGAAVGSGLNVLIYRLPCGKSPLWPPSACGVCLHPIRWRDNVPILSYLRLRGRCRDCGTRFSPRYLVVELVTGLGFAGLLGLEVFANWHDLTALSTSRAVLGGDVPPAVWLWYLAHVYLFSLAVVQFCCRLDGASLPLAVALPGMLAGALAAVFGPWPWPNEFSVSGVVPVTGLQLCPVAYPLPEGIPPGSLKLGLVGWFSGLSAAWFFTRPAYALSRRKTLSSVLGDTLFLVTAGGLLGLVAVTLCAALAALLAVTGLFVRRFDWPFGAWQAVALALVLLGWPWLRPLTPPLTADGAMGTLALVVSTFLLAATVYLGDEDQVARRRRKSGSGSPPPGPFIRSPAPPAGL